MAEYIEREAVMQKFADHVTRSNNSDFAPTPTWNQAVQIVEDIPTADVVSVVRCGECKWSDNYGLDLLCQRHSGITKNKLGEDIHFVEWHSKNFFCADGKRKDGDGDV